MKPGFVGFMVRRALMAAPTLLGVTIVVFLMVRVLPGDPARLLAGLFATPQEVERIRAQLGLTRPLVVQYGIFLAGLLHGSLGPRSSRRIPSRPRSRAGSARPRCSPSRPRRSRARSASSPASWSARASTPARTTS
jgi:hypothetical protein